MLGGQLFGPGGNTTPEIGSMGSQYGLLQRRQSGKGCAVPARCPSIPAISSLCAPSAWREESTQRSVLANRSMSDDDHNLDDLKDRLYGRFCRGVGFSGDKSLRRRRPKGGQRSLRDISAEVLRPSHLPASQRLRSRAPRRPIDGQHAANTAAALFRRSDRRRRSSGRPFVCDDLLEALDTVLGEGRDAILADAVDAQAAVFGEHVDREFV